MASEEQVLEQLKWVTAQLRTARAAAAAQEAAAREPIAVVGIGCRFPGGVTGPDELWTLVDEGRDATGEVPHARGWDALPWFHPDPDHAGTSYVRRGGFLDDAAGFDSGFFGIAPREALAMDPQQRLLLETSWEAFERAGIDPDDLAGTDVGVFAGVAYNGYGGGSDEHAGHGLTGASPAVAAGRLSYTFGFHGPAVTVDTMCSSSLVALHLAARSLRAGECTTALAAAAMVISDPTEFVEFSRQGALSPDGRCRPFSAHADGTAWAEGVGVLLLEPLSRARELGHPVWAVVRGSALNHDGRSNGLTAPNGTAQRAVIKAALAQAALHPHEIDVVEAHGTGTRLGDPIEARALAEVYGGDRPRGPLMLGSVKSNIGHAQAAGGLAGVIKTIMALRNGRMPATLHAEEPTTEADWNAGVALLDAPREWPAGPAPRRAAVSSFGASGTNAHVILEEAPAAEPDGADGPAMLAVPLSALDGAALRGQAAAHARALSGPLADVTPAQVGAALAHRHEFPERAAVVADDPAELIAALERLAAGEPDPAVVTGRALPAPRVVFVFPGQGAQWAGMAAELIDRAPAFTAALTECEAALAAHVSWTVRDVLREAPGAPDLGRVDVVQPVMWAVDVALAAQWRAHGVEPTAVVGHSQGEVAATVVAGAITVADGARIIAERSRLVGARLAGGGAMASLRMAAPERDALLARTPDVELAGHTSPTSVVVSGTPDGVARLVAAAPDHARAIDVDYASHTHHVAVLRDELAAAVGTVTPVPTGVAVYSTVTGARIDPAALDADHWWSNLREPVRFEQAVRAAAGAGMTLFVEVSPHPVLGGAVAEILESTGVDGAVLETLRRGHGDETALRRALAAAWTRGAPVQLGGAGPSIADRLPTYAFQRSPYWIAPAAPSGAPAADELRLAERWVPLETPPTTDPGSVLVLAAEGAAEGAAAVAERCAAALDAQVALVPLDGESIAAAVAAHQDGPVVSLLGLAGGDATVRATLQLLRSAGPAPVWVLTRGAVRAGSDAGAPDPDQAALWGLVRVAALERPETVGGLVDLPVDGDSAGLAEVIAGSEDEIALRDGSAYVRRIVPAPAVAADPWTPPECVAVTGATGQLGGEVARRLVAAGARRLVLPTRRPLSDPVVEALCADLRERGAEPVAVTCDLTSDDAVSALAGDHAAGEIVHTAQRALLAPLSELDADELTAALDLALGAARRLAASFGPDVPLTTFASATGMWGAADHAVLAVPGPALAAFAEQERASGGAASALYWGVWAVPGTDPDEASPTRHGLPPLDPGVAAAAFARVRAAGQTGVAVADVDWDTFTSLYALRRATHRFDEIIDVPEAGTDDGGLRARLDATPAAERDAVLLDAVLGLCAQVLGHQDGSAVAPRTPLKELGFDSLMSVDLRNRLQAAAGTALRATIVFDFPTPQALAGHLRDVLGGTGGGEVPLAETVARLEAALLDDPAGTPEMPALVRRIDEAVAAWRRAGAAPGPVPAPDGPPGDGDDDALLSFIRDQLGKPA